MGISELQAQIEDDRREIGILENECAALEQVIRKLYEAEFVFHRESMKFLDYLEDERNQAKAIAVIQNVKIASGCADSLHEHFGPKSQDAVLAIEKIAAIYKAVIAEKEEELRLKKLRINALYDDISACNREIESIREAQRRAAAAAAAAAAAKSSSSGSSSSSISTSSSSKSSSSSSSNSSSSSSSSSSKNTSSSSSSSSKNTSSSSSSPSKNSSSSSSSSSSRSSSSSSSKSK